MLWVLGDGLAVQAAGGTGSKASVVAPEVSAVSVKFELALMALAKLSFVGGGAVMGKPDGLEFAPPGGGVKTVTLPLPPVAISLAAMATVIWVGEHAEGVWETPRKNTIEPTPCVGLQLKPVPLTCRLKTAPPTVLVAGTREVIVGAAPSTLKRRKSEVLAPSTTVIWCTPSFAAVNKLGSRVAVNLLGLNGLRGIIFTPAWLPSHCTLEFGVKLAPSTAVSVTAVVEPA